MRRVILLRRSAFALAGATLMMLALSGCATSEAVGGERGAPLQDRADLAMKEITTADPSLRQVMNSGYAYVILPNIGKAALVVGGAGGQGIVYRNGKPIGTATLNQLSVGPQVGGESYAELVVFQNEAAFNRFTNGDLAWGAQASATIVKAGTAAGDRFDQGVSVYLLPKGGLEVGASLNGQKLTFHPDNSGNGNG